MFGLSAKSFLTTPYHSMPACQACHNAKVRCTQEEPACHRCRRLSLDCVPHVSRQGQGPKPRKKRCHTGAGAGGTATTEDEVVLQQIQDMGRYHYGVMYMVHMWTSYAFARRSFRLLGKASKLAERSGIPMDDIFNDTRRPILDPLFYRSKEKSIQAASSDSQPSWLDVPPKLGTACALTGNSANIAERYIMLRDCDGGDSRYLLSAAFERDIESRWINEQKWRANEEPVAKLFLRDASDFSKFSQAVNYQVARYREPSVPPTCARTTGLFVKLKQNNGTTIFQEMDLIHALEIVSLERSFFLFEFVPPKRHVERTTAEMAKFRQQEDTKDGETSDGLAFFDNLEELGMDKDIEMWFDLLGGN